jgi:opacity protein-like surface antigen
MIRRLCLITALLAAGAAVARAQEAKAAAAPAPAAAATEAQVEGMLFFASDKADAPDQKEKVTIDAGLLKNITGRLAKAFKFQHFHLIGKHTQKVFKGYESWVVPSQDLCLKMDYRGPADGGGLNLHLQLWQDKNVLVKTDTIIRKDRPVFLGGPDWRGGRLIFVVVLK